MKCWLPGLTTLITSSIASGLTWPSRKIPDITAWSYESEYKRLNDHSILSNDNGKKVFGTYKNNAMYIVVSLDKVIPQKAWRPWPWLELVITPGKSPIQAL